MPTIKIDRDRCKGCGLCIKFCPQNLIKVDSSLNHRGIKPALFLKGKCLGCCQCAIMCPEVCIEVYR